MHISGEEVQVWTMWKGVQAQVSFTASSGSSSEGKQKHEEQEDEEEEQDDWIGVKSLNVKVICSVLLFSYWSRMYLISDCNFV